MGFVQYARASGCPWKQHCDQPYSLSVVHQKKRVTQEELKASFESPTGEKETAASMLTSAVKEKAAFQNKMLSTLHEIRDYPGENVNKGRSSGNT